MPLIRCTNVFYKGDYPVTFDSSVVLDGIDFVVSEAELDGIDFVESFREIA